MEQTKQLQQSKASVTLSSEGITALVKAASDKSLQNLKENYNIAYKRLQARTEKSIEELTLMGLICATNDKNTKAEASLIRNVAILNFDITKEGLPLYYYNGLLGFEQLLQLLNETIAYFTTQSKVQNNLTPADINAISVTLVTGHSELKYSDLLFMLSKAMTGYYNEKGQIYRIDRQIFFNWLTEYYRESSAHYEQQYINNKKEEPNLARVSDKKDPLREFETLQQAKKKIMDKVWGDKKQKNNESAGTGNEA